MTRDRETGPSASADDAPLDRTGETITKADLFDTAHWLGRRLDTVQDQVSRMAGDSGDITQRIMGDLAGIRAEQIHLARRIEALRSEMRTDLRAELQKPQETSAPDREGRKVARRPGRYRLFLLGFIAPIILILLTALILPEQVRTLGQILDHWTDGIDRFPSLWREP